MSYLGIYLDQLIEKKRLNSDTELAKFLQISRQHMSRIRKEGSMSDEKCMVLAKELDINPLELFALVRAKKSKTKETREIWMQLHRETKRVKAYILLNSNE
ncbi:MAG: helix-turn-helix domain-containing protein [Pseudomonadales bacterium]|nr:helix-turn-helix domain-containing protein [Pseudomonadales bacterium]